MAAASSWRHAAASSADSPTSSECPRFCSRCQRLRTCWCGHALCQACAMRRASVRGSVVEVGGRGAHGVRGSSDKLAGNSVPLRAESPDGEEDDLIFRLSPPCLALRGRGDLERLLVLCPFVVAKREARLADVPRQAGRAGPRALRAARRLQSVWRRLTDT